MRITLTIEKSPDPALIGSRMSFGQEGGSLGRGADNDWVLPDPNCYTSGRHARIRADGAGFVVDDLSTNGTFHNEPERLIGKQRSAELNDGDRLFIGEFVIVVSLEPERESSSAPSADSADDDQDSLLGVTAAVQAPEPPPRDEFDDLLDAADVDQHDQHDGTAESILPESGRAPYAVGRELEQDEAEAKTGESERSARFDQSPEREYFAPPAGKDSASDDIPDEWDALLTGFFEPPSVAGASPARTHDGEDRAQESPARESAKPGLPPRPARSRQQPLSGSGDSAVVERIMHELGIEADADQVDPEDFAVQLGRVVRMVGEGLMQLLLSRAEIKNEFRIDQTRISSSRNNPLKFSPSIEEAMRRVFIERDVPGFISGAEAFEQALNDLRAHQMAILAAVQGAIESVIRQFDPAELETQLKKISPFSASAPLIREAKCWNLFTSHYEDMAANLRQDARQVFVREFAEAYEEASRDIARRFAESGSKPGG